MAKFAEKRERGNIIRVAEKSVASYAWALLLSGQPDVYDQYDEIKIQVTMAHLNTAELLIKVFRQFGLEETEREKKEIKVVKPSGESYILPNAYEITLRKIPALLHI